MPDEIKYLSIVESLLNPNAVSWCGATGLWQFMPGTGKMMDLRIDNDVDERKDMYKSTEKACEYLQSNYNRFGDWLLALAAYNGGPGNVNKAITRSGGKKTFWEICTNR
jgi:membrane-bound lytic murein transglycosylase D